ncbi:aromatic motif membrane protein [Mycoplasmopsis alligatoris]|uniref:Lipoprotein n=1 Tax=Mycoplasmopsis alligatoris A21JP2 TaxID=747682 RepID=D4XW88_9BACT|nr:aromatic motif membrane protein [Mycoplasmopsis alligatoris]EFF41381.1 hypothetical protein MALL_0751 [Mycoplasmopsis alligatoris A21JP2]
MKIKKLICLATCLIAAPLAISSCAQSNLIKEEKITVLKKESLKQEEFLEQKAIKDILEQVYLKDEFEPLSKEELEKQKQLFIKEQLYDKSEALSKELEKILTYYTIPYSLSLSVGFFDEAPKFSSHYEQEFINFFKKNWLFTLYNIDKFDFIGSSEALTGEGGQFSIKYASYLPWIINIKSNKILDHVLNVKRNKYYADEEGNQKSSLIKNGDYQAFEKVFYLKMEGNFVINLTITRRNDFENIKDFKKEVKVFPEYRLRVLEKLLSGQIKEFSLVNFANNFLFLNHELDVTTPANNEIRKDYTEEKYGDIIPYYIAGFINERNK